jgi:hypothetical protein
LSTPFQDGLAEEGHVQTLFHDGARLPIVDRLLGTYQQVKLFVFGDELRVPLMH